MARRVGKSLSVTALAIFSRKALISSMMLCASALSGWRGGWARAGKAASSGKAARSERLSILRAYARLSEGRHAVVAGGGRLEERHRQRRRRGLAQAHAEVDQG